MSHHIRKRQELERAKCAALLGISLLSVCLLAVGIGAVQAQGGGLTPRDPISIVGDSSFTPSNGVNGGGSGTADDPCIIENWAIDASGGSGIYISNTTKYFVIRNCLVENGGFGGGIYLDSVVNGKIENNTCENNSGYGILLTSSSYNTLTNNTCLNNSGTDIILSASTNNILTNNTIDDIILVSARMDTPEGVVILVHTNFNNTIFHNYLLNNAQDDGINHWDNGSEGNYWSDWQPPAHPSSNGIVVDTPRPIASGTTLIADGTNADRYPLVLPNVITTTTTNTETTVTTTNTGTTTPPTQTDSTATPTQPWPVILASIGIAAVIVVTVAVKMHGR